MRYAARERTLGLHRMILTGDVFSRDEEWLRFNKFGGEFARARLKILSMPLSDEEKEMMELQSTLTKQTLGFQHRIIELIETGQLETAREVLQRAAIPAQNRVLDQLTAFYEFQEKEADSARRRLHLNYQSSQQILAATTIVFILVCLMLALLVTRRVRRREEELLARLDDAKHNSLGQSQLLGKSGYVFSEQVHDLQQHLQQAVDTARSHKQFNKHVQVHTSAALSKADYIGNLSALLIENARLETGQETLRFGSVEIYPLIQDLVEKMKPYTLRNNNSLNVHCAEDIGVIITDSKRFCGMLLGVLQNTCSITEYGIITLSVNRGKSHLSIRIEDTGNGLNQDKVQALLTDFDADMLGDDKEMHWYGLILSLERRICRLLHGDLWVCSEENIGISCNIRLPLNTPISSSQ
jgi:signal transduction histidine kinase